MVIDRYGVEMWSKSHRYWWKRILCREFINKGKITFQFEDSSERSKRRKSQELRANYSAEELTYAAQMKIRESGNIDAANIC